MATTPVEAIKERLDIVDFIKGYLQLQPAGKNFKALCPFHREKTPSFMVSPERQSWHCFGCGAGGDIFSFLMRYENIEFGEALKILAEKAGIELRRVSPAEYKQIGLLYDINEKAKDFFRGGMESSKVASDYISGRGLEKNTLEEFEIGFAPTNPDALLVYLINSGFHPDDILRAGLSFKTERGLQMDRFRGRIIFPIHNHLGKIVGFTGRILPTTPTNADDTRTSVEKFQRSSAFSQRESAIPKYVNSPETPVFSKSKILYGLFKSKNHIREAKNALLVEGQMDFLASWQAGIKNVVASSGTALTADHLRVLRRLTDQLVVSFDNDDAGLEAGERAIDLAEANDFGVKVALFRDYKDPADAAISDKKYFFEVIEGAKPAAEFYFEKYLPGGEFSVRNRDDFKNLRIVLEKIGNIGSPVLKSFWLKELSKRVGVNELTLAEEMERKIVAKKDEREGNNDTNIIAKKFSRWEVLSQRCLAWILHKEDFESKEFFPHLPGAYREIFSILESGGRRSEDPLLDELLNLIVFQQREASMEEFEALKMELYKEYVKERRRELASIIGGAERSGDDELLRKAMQELDNLPGF